MTTVAAVEMGGFSGTRQLGGGEVLERENPARTDEIVGRLSCSTPDEVSVAVQTAAAAGRSWSQLDVAERAEAVRAAGAAVGAVAEELAPLLARELGKPRADCAGEMGFAAAWSAFVADRVADVCADRLVDDAQGRLLVAREPHGVVAAIVPWNAPLILSMLKVAPALATGNTIVVKPSPVAPFAVTRALEVLASHLPPGVLGVVHGEAEAGAALVGHPQVAKVAFTGGEAGATAVLHSCAETLTPTVMELGGNDAAILLDDLTLDAAAAERLAFGAFLNSGQVCMAAKRLLVPRDRHDEVVEVLVEAAGRVLVGGDPLDPAVTVGPVATRVQRDRISGLVEDAVSGGATVIPLGRTTADWDPARGWFVEPALVLGARPDAPVVVQEQFGPILPVVAYDDEEEAVSLANASEHGLASSVWSDDVERAFAVARRVEAGTTFVNCHNRAGMSLRAPFGGIKRSGWGREFGDEGILGYTRTHAVHLPGALRAAADGTGGLAGNAYPGQ